MSNTVKALVIAAVVATVGVVGVVALGGSDDETETQPQTTTETQTPSTDNSQPKEREQQEAAVTITYSDNGFSPASTTINAGESILFKNESSSTLELESDPHPVHTDNTELNIGSIASGASQTVTLSQTGTWGFHNHLNSSHEATVEVK